ncbi:MAG: hypothetical protein NDF53_02390 [archaeon GB-1867-097]|nr:hypothetical protein [Candidatus Verstraetearchaeota archaeon]MCS7374823.1 hypothetical protein [Candidatus Culexmicrobium thermophilum]MCS7384562.1 hypothetical protein [Candidatus Culexmicrobium thermophilum]RLE56967.1 MAG: hypothetical protein DRJ30_00790 [Candidatus Verstraetearchaeota archaeon]HDO20752.1 hypothetical protein [Candidatus Bathyarchaeota archaeon]
MEFCEKCGRMLVPERRNGKVVLVCKRCGFVKPLHSGSYKVTYAVGESKRRKITIVSEAELKRIKKSKEEQELMEDYYKLFLDTYEQSESEGEPKA